MNRPSDLPGLSVPGWSRAERGALIVLLLLLVGLFVFRAQSRRLDDSRIPLNADFVLIHVAGLRADALTPAELAADLGLPSEELLVWSNAYAPSGDARRSLLSLLRGDLVLNLEAQPGPGSLAARFSAAGWQTVFVGEGELPQAASHEFQRSYKADNPKLVPETLVEALSRSDVERPLLLMIHLGSTGRPLHTTTTDSEELTRSYRQRITDLRGDLARIAQALKGRTRPRIVTLAGGSGLELGGHPDAPDRPWQDHLRVPLLMSLQGASGLPRGELTTMVQSTDLTPTLFDLVDLRPTHELKVNRGPGAGRSLEALMHGWELPPVHEQLLFADVGHAAICDERWKLIAPVDAPWALREDAVMLFALEEDPTEQHDLAVNSPLGPVGTELLGQLRRRLARPEEAVAER